MVTQLVNSRAEIQTQVSLTPNPSPCPCRCSVAQSVVVWALGVGVDVCGGWRRGCRKAASIGVIWRGLLSLTKQTIRQFCSFSAPTSVFLERNCVGTGSWGGSQGSRLPRICNFSFFLQSYLLSISCYITASTPPIPICACWERGKSGPQGRVVKPCFQVAERSLAWKSGDLSLGHLFALD